MYTYEMRTLCDDDQTKKSGLPRAESMQVNHLYMLHIHVTSVHSIYVQLDTYDYVARQRYPF